MRFMIKEKGGVNADVFIEFLKRLMVGADMRGIAEVNLGIFSLRKGLDPRIFLLQKLLHERFISLQCTA